MSILRSLFRPKPPLALESAKPIVNQFLLVMESMPTEVGAFIPADALSHSPQKIYEALVSVALHDGDWVRWESTASLLSRITSDGYDAVASSWALVTEHPDHLAKSEKEARIRLQADAGDFNAQVKQDFNALQRSRPRKTRPRFVNQRFESFPNPKEVELIVHEFGAIISERNNVLEFSTQSLDTTMETICCSLAYWYTCGSQQTDEDYNHFVVGSMFLAHACSQEEFHVIETLPRKSSDFSNMDAEERESLQRRLDVDLNSANRAAFAIRYWKRIFHLMCNRFAYWHDVKLPERSLE